jgi:hypothetical protein
MPGRARLSVLTAALLGAAMSNLITGAAAHADVPCLSRDLGHRVGAAIKGHPLMARPDLPVTRPTSLVQRGGGRNFVFMVDEDAAIQNADWYRDPDRVVDSLLRGYYMPGAADPQFLAFFTAFPIAFNGAFYAPVANDVTGIGAMDPLGDAEVYDNSPMSSLEGLVVMNDYGRYLRQPQELGFTFNQELGHRWGSFVRFDDGSGPSGALLGRDEAHWSFFFHTMGSPMEGNFWSTGRLTETHGTPDPTTTTERGWFTTTTDQLPALRYMPLDLYLMGLMTPEEVPPFMLLTDTTTFGALDLNGRPVAPSSPPEVDGPVELQGTPQWITVDEIIAAHGPRNPPASDQPRTQTIAFVLIVRPDQAHDQQLVDNFADLVDRAVGGWATATGGRASLDVVSAGTPLPPPVSFGQSCPGGILDCNPAQSTACVAPHDPSLSSPAVCTVLCNDSDVCPRGYCCMPGADAISYCFAHPLGPGQACAPGNGAYPELDAGSPEQADAGGPGVAPDGGPQLAHGGCSQAPPGTAAPSLLAGALLLLLLLAVALRS